MKLIHGGDCAGFEAEYGRAPLDFSANSSPFGLPEGVRRAVTEALGTADRYPDPLCRALRASLAAFHGTDAERIVCGNGAADLIYRLCHVLKPRKAAVFAPCFAEYERALRQTGCVPDRLALPETEDFRLAGSPEIPDGCELLFLCNPNNPTGLLCARETLDALLFRCRETGMHLVADECFLDFCEERENNSLIPELARCGQLIVLKAFTKTWGMAGLRLGYALCGDAGLSRKLLACGQPWPVSSLAQAGGLAALKEIDYVNQTRSCISAERDRMLRALCSFGLRVIPGRANFLLFFTSDAELGEKLRGKGILLRDCSNYPGLRQGWFRTAVRTPAENSTLLETMGEALGHG